MKKFLPLSLSIITGLALTACGDDSTDNQDSSTNVEDSENHDHDGDAPNNFTFESRYLEGESSVFYSGQTTRYLLWSELTAAVKNIGDETTGQDVKDLLKYYVDYADVGGAMDDAIESYSLNGEDSLKQSFFSDVSSSAPSLSQKLPENDIGWTTTVKGWSGATTTYEVIDDLIESIGDAYQEGIDGIVRLDPLGNPIEKDYVLENGVDAQQVLQKFINGAVMYSQGVADYLGDDVEGKGILSDNTEAVVKNGEAKTYTALEHVWDESFGYFGAARDFLEYTAEEAAGKGGREDFANAYHDSNGDGFIDLKSEINQGYAVTASKRDRAGEGLSLGSDIVSAYLQGRHLISTSESWGETELGELQEIRDSILANWERAIAATTVHYVNDTLKDLSMDASEYDFATHAKHWSELLGYALMLQFNPDSRIPGVALDGIYAVIGSAPLIPGVDSESDIQDYKAAIRALGDQLVDDLGLPASLKGDANGEGGF